MKHAIQKLAVFTSGGDAPGMNAAIRAVVRTGLYHDLEVYGVRRGYEGVIDGDMVRMESSSVSNIIQQGGTMLKSARSARFHTPEGRKVAYQQLKGRGIDGIVAIGGDGTFAGARQFAQEYPDLRVVGVPGTIDNDLAGSDFTIGYDTAINTAMRAIDQIRDTADAHNRLFFIEVMGRDAGLIALRAGLASGAEAILVPELKTDMTQLIELLQTGWKRHKSSFIVVVAEGDEQGGAFRVAERVKEQFDNYETKVTVLGHIQRGGSPTCADRVLASRLGSAAVETLAQGQSGVMVGLVHDQLTFTSFDQAIKHQAPLNPQLVNLISILSS